LAARGTQTRICRVIAVVMIGLGAIPLALIGSSVGPQGFRDRLVAVIIAACCLVMATFWLKPRWPSRAQSVLCVVIGTVCIAAASVITPSPVVGLFGTTAFAVVAAYTACFHTGRLLTFTWTVAGATVIILAVRLAAQDAALAVCSVVLVALVNIFVAFACRMVIRLISNDVHHAEIEPLTGLLNRDAFYQKAAVLMASRSRDDDRYFVVAVVNIDNYSVHVDIAGAAAGHRARVTVGQTLRETVRHNAIVAHVNDAEFLIADTFTTADPSPLVERVRSTIATTASGLTASIGVVSTPLRPLIHHPPHEVLDELIAIATTAMSGARRGGGNQGSCVLHPVLTLLGEPDIEA
jgi:diguanylate cyclase (GGDEF)-like protein